MIVASLSRMSLGKPGWTYLDFIDMEALVDWALGEPEKAQGIHHVFEFRAGKPVELPAAEWCNAIQEAKCEQRAWDKHLHLARTP